MNINKQIFWSLSSIFLVAIIFLSKPVLAIETGTNNNNETLDLISVRMVYPLDGTIISEDIFIAKVYAPNAQYVEFYISSSSLYPKKVGTAQTRTNDGVFELSINSKDFVNGYYVLVAKAFFSEINMSAQSSFKIDRKVEVMEEKVVESVSTTTNTQPITNSDVVVKNKTVTITKPTAKTVIQSKTLEVVIFSPDAEKVELRVKKSGSDKYEYFATAKKGSSGNWITVIDNITRLPNGRHYFQARAKIEGNEYKSNEIYIDISILEYELPLEKNQELSQSTVSNITENTQESLNYEQRSDPDGDGLTNEEERILGTNPNDADTDKDGLSDGEEVRLGTDPLNPDSDRDGFLDGDEVRNGFDPLKYSPGDGSDRIVYENPKEAGEVKAGYFVEKVSLIEKEEGEKRLSISGKAIPNSFVTIYIYSEPIIVTVKTDAYGNWIYELDKDIEDGEHEVYVAVTDNTGKITGKSEPIRFIKTAEAASIVPSAQAQEILKNQSPAQRLKNDMMIYGFLIMVIFMGIALAIVGVINHKHSYDQQSN